MSSGFIGFSSFAVAEETKAGTDDSDAIQRSENSKYLPLFYDGSNGTLSLLYKKLTKKDSQTKLKALTELCGYFTAATEKTTPTNQETYDSISSEDLAQSIPHLIHLFRGLVVDNDRRIRELATDVISQVICAFRKNVVMLLDMFIGSWWMCMSDPTTEVSAASVRSFEKGFPSEKRRYALISLHHSKIFFFLCETLRKNAEELTDITVFSAEEAEKRHERVMNSCLVAMCSLISLDPNYVPILTAEQVKYVIEVLLKFLIDSRASCRKNAAQLLSVLCERCSTIIADYMILCPPNKLFLKLSHVTLNLINEGNASNHSSVWSAILNFIKVCPSLVENSNIESILLKPMLTKLSSGFFISSSEVSYSSLLPLLAVIPNSVYQKMKMEFPTYLHKFLDSIKQGLNKSKSDSVAMCTIVQSYSECAIYIYKRFSDEISMMNSEQIEFFRYNIRAHIFEALELWVNETDGLGLNTFKMLNRPHVAAKVRVLTESMSQDVAYSLRSGFANSFVEFIWELLLKSSDVGARLISQLLVQSFAISGKSVECKSAITSVFLRLHYVMQNGSGVPKSSLLVAMNEISNVLRLSNILTEDETLDLSKEIFKWIQSVPTKLENVCVLLELYNSVLLCLRSEVQSKMKSQLILKYWNEAEGMNIIADILLKLRDVTLLDSQRKECIDPQFLSLVSNLDHSDSFKDSTEVILSCFGIFHGKFLGEPAMTDECIGKVNLVQEYSPVFASSLLPFISSKNGCNSLLKTLHPSSVSRVLVSAMHSSRKYEHVRAVWKKYSTEIFSKNINIWEEFNSYMRIHLQSSDIIQDAVDDLMEIIQLETTINPVCGGILWVLNILKPNGWIETSCFDSPPTHIKLAKYLLRALPQTAAERLRFLYNGILRSPVESKEENFCELILAMMNNTEIYEVSSSTFEYEYFVSAAMENSHTNCSPLARAIGIDFGASCLIDHHLFTENILLPSLKCKNDEDQKSSDPFISETLFSVHRLAMKSLLTNVENQLDCPFSMQQAASELSRYLFGYSFSEGIGSSLNERMKKMKTDLFKFEETNRSLEEDEVYVGQRVCYRRKGDITKTAVNAIVACIHRDSLKEAAYVTLSLDDSREVQTELSNLFHLPSFKSSVQSIGHDGEYKDFILNSFFDIFVPYEAQIKRYFLDGTLENINSFTSTALSSLDIVSLYVRCALSFCESEQCHDNVLPLLRDIWRFWCDSTIQLCEEGTDVTVVKINRISVQLKVLSSLFKCTPFLMYQRFEMVRLFETLLDFLSARDKDVAEEDVWNFEQLQSLQDSVIQFTTEVLSAECADVHMITEYSQIKTRPLGLIEEVLLKCRNLDAVSKPCHKKLYRAYSNILSCEAALLLHGRREDLSQDFLRIAVNDSLDHFVSSSLDPNNLDQQIEAATCPCILNDILTGNHTMVKSSSKRKYMFDDVVENSEKYESLFTVLRLHGKVSLQVCAYNVLSSIASCATVIEAEDFELVPSTEADETDCSDFELAAEKLERKQRELEISTAERCIPSVLLKIIDDVQHEIEFKILDFTGDDSISFDTSSNSVECSELQQERFSSFSCFLPWLLYLVHIRRADACEANARSVLSSHLKNLGVVTLILHACLSILHDKENFIGKRQVARDLSKLNLVQLLNISRSHGGEDIAVYTFFYTALMFPAVVRTWWTDLPSKGLKIWIEDFTRMHITPPMISREIEQLTYSCSSNQWNHDGLNIRASGNAGEVSASYMRDESELSLRIRMPSNYPLKQVEVDCPKQLGISENRHKRWVLQINTLMSARGGSVLDVVLLWKKNVDKEFEGLEPCVICYSTLHPKDMTLPSLTCKTCSNQFHPACLYKWFQTSHKSKCPLCQQNWA